MLLADLPIEILPEIIDHVAKPQHLAHLCLVNKAFHRFAVEKLYERIYIYSWHREGKAKACKVQYIERNRVNHLKSGYSTFRHFIPTCLPCPPLAPIRYVSEVIIYSI